MNIYRIAGLPGPSKVSNQPLRFAVVVWQKLNADVRVAGWYTTEKKAKERAFAIRQKEGEELVTTSVRYTYKAV